MGVKAEPALGLVLGVAHLPHGVAHHPGLPRQGCGEGQRDGEGQALGQGGQGPVGEAQAGVLLVEEEGDAEEARRHPPGEAGVPPGAEHRLGPEAPEEGLGPENPLEHLGGLLGPQGAPVQLPRGDEGVGDGGLGEEAGPEAPSAPR